MKKFNILKFEIYKKLNLKLIKQFKKIFKNIQIKFYGFDIKIILKKKSNV